MAGKARKVPKRTENIIVRMNPEEVRMVQELAAARGKSVSEWIREQIYNSVLGAETSPAGVKRKRHVNKD